MKVRCIDAKGHENVLREGNIYEGELKFIDSIGEERWSIKESRGSIFYKHRFEEVKGLTLQEVMSNIKQGEIYENKNTAIHLNNEGVLIMEEKSHFNNTDMNILTASMIAINLDSEYQLQRKEHTFEEAFKAYEEGKEIECCYGGQKLKKENEKDYYFNYDKEEYMPLKFDEVFFDIANIRSKWYIND